MTCTMTKERMRKRSIRNFAKLIRKITVAPIMAFIAFTLIAIIGNVYTDPLQYIASIIFITVLPIMAYPLQGYLPAFRDKGREGQRTLAIIMANVGYIMSIIYSVIFQIPDKLLNIYLTYVFSGIAILIFNKVLKIRASGHACGLAGPIGVLVYYLGLTTPAAVICAIIGVTLLALVIWASTKTHSHTASQLIIGALIPIVIFYAIIFISAM